MSENDPDVGYDPNAPEAVVKTSANCPNEDYNGGAPDRSRCSLVIDLRADLANARLGLPAPGSACVVLSKEEHAALVARAETAEFQRDHLDTANTELTAGVARLAGELEAAKAETETLREVIEDTHETLDNLCASLVNLVKLPDAIHVKALREALPRLRDDIATRALEGAK